MKNSIYYCFRINTGKLSLCEYRSWIYDCVYSARLFPFYPYKSGEDNLNNSLRQIWISFTQKNITSDGQIPECITCDGQIPECITSHTYTAIKRFVFCFRSLAIWLLFRCISQQIRYNMLPYFQVVLYIFWWLIDLSSCILFCLHNHPSVLLSLSFPTVSFFFFCFCLRIPPHVVSLFFLFFWRNMQLK